MNTPVTSREAILETCRQLVAEQGLSALNMRSVAKAGSVALGSIYYYFPSKNDLLIAAIESVWEDIFRWQDTDAGPLPFPAYIERCFRRIQLGIRKYPNFFNIHAISFSAKGQTQAQDSMEQYLAHIRANMMTALQLDQQVRTDAFSAAFTPTLFADFALSNIISLLIAKKDDCAVLLEVIRRTIYQTDAGEHR